MQHKMLEELAEMEGKDGLAEEAPRMIASTASCPRRVRRISRIKIC